MLGKAGMFNEWIEGKVTDDVCCISLNRTTAGFGEVMGLIGECWRCCIWFWLWFKFKE